MPSSSSSSSSCPIPASVLARYAAFAAARVRPFGAGLINQTFLVESPQGARAVFQRQHPSFSSAVNTDLEAVTEHLVAKGMTTPRLLRTTDDARFVEDSDGRIWRALTFVQGECGDRLTCAAQAREAGALVARFHAALSDFSLSFVHVREGVHDMARHLATLQRALEAHPHHRLHAAVSRISESLFEAAPSLPDFSAAPLRVCHGDLKISNLMFRDGAGHCLIDLDTVGLQRWPFEMGDALRSWCNGAGEDVSEAMLSVELFEAAVAGYDEANPRFPTSEEWALLVEGLATICLELTSRFLADALNEAYFGFDSTRFPARGEHNLLRGQGQWALFRDVRNKRGELEALVRRHTRKV
ncbi:MAG: phosphotransferase [Myxococcales bacterium]|jgi:Ser/Thr protein kinase RdoA (MazF antagonist)|nr:phosphotransferase [Myxococcales bacterium]